MKFDQIVLHFGQAHKKTLKPKGMIYLAGYEVKESADNAKIEQLKALAKKLGLDEESLPLPEKFPPHTLALSHERRRKYYITAADEDDKKEWVEMFKTCCRKARGKELRNFTMEKQSRSNLFYTLFTLKNTNDICRSKITK